MGKRVGSWTEWIRPRFYHLFAPLAVLALIALLGRTPLLDLLENLTVDLRFQARAAFDPPADSRVLLVGIDQKSIDHLGAWPWPRTTEADFLKTIAASGADPHTVAFDLLFTDDFDKAMPGRKDDEILSEAAGTLPSVVTGALSFVPEHNAASEATARKRTQDELAQPSLTAPLPDIKGDKSRIIGSDSAIFPIRPLRRQSLFGFVNDEPSVIDHIRRSMPLLIRVRDKVYPSFALQILCQMLNVDPDHVEVDLPERVVRLSNSSHQRWTIPVNERGEFAINYRREDGFRRVSFVALLTALLDHAENGAPLSSEADIRNKTLVVGQVATGLTDLGPTPLQSDSPLIYTHLNVIDNVLRGDYLRFVPWPWVAAGWLLLTWATLFALRHASIKWAISMPILVAILYTLSAFALFWLWSLQVALAWPLIGYGAVNFGAVVLRWREERRGKQQIKLLFARMLSSEIMNHLLDHPGNVKLGGSIRAVTILFSDIRDYTKFSEHIDTEELVRQLNVYFERMVACVQDCRGTFHKFIGDAVMAAWGDIAAVSATPEEDARNAVRSALMMRRKLRELNEERAGAGLVPLRIGIGLNHGDVLVGQIGAASRSEFTVIGDPVNVASRLEGMTKTFHTDLAIGESVRLLIGDTFLVRRLGLIQLKGKTKPMVVYEVLAESADLQGSSMGSDTVARYERAFDDFLSRRFPEAQSGFQACVDRHPGDYCSQRYLQAAREFSVQPPPPDWDGRIILTEK
jgi:adenylate cyclase